MQYYHVIKQGPQDDLFEELLPSAVVAASPNETENADAEQNIDPALFASGNRAEDIAFVRNQGLQVDDNNEPVPENVTLPNQQSNATELNEGQEWGCDCIDKRAITGAVNLSPKFQDGWQPKKKSLLGNF